MKPLYPPLKTNAEYTLAVDPPHALAIEESGNPKGIPILFVHGGPGAGTCPDNRRFFNPEKYRIILFDQRGCGRSTPFGELENNNTQALVRDMEAIRNHIGVSQWILFGGSWGATLSLCYAQAHPNQVMGLILRGVFLGRPQDIDWFIKPGGASRVFPDYWETFQNYIPVEERGDLLQAYYKRLRGDDEVSRLNAAKHFAQWEAQSATLHPCKTIIEQLTNAHTALSLSLIETHYLKENCFLLPNQLLKDISKINGTPGIIVHGRYDMICALENAYTLHKAWPASQLNIIRDAGHSAAEAGITDALVNATDEMAYQFQ